MNRTLVIATIASLTTATVAMSFFGADTLKVRKLDDFAEIGVPKSMKEEWYKGDRDRWLDRLVFTFVSTYTWGSMGGTAYKQALTVTIISPHATDTSYQRAHNATDISLSKRSVVHDATLGTGHLTVTKGVYEKNSVVEPSHEFVYVDKTRRLRIDWHATEKEVKFDEGIELIARVAASYKMLREPVATFNELRDRPEKEADERARKEALAKATLAKEGFTNLVPGTPQQRGEMYVEWMADPEPRYQLLIPLGRIRASSPDGGPAPRPFTLKTADGQPRSLPGSVGWYAKADEGWEFSNNTNSYYPFDGIQGVLKTQHKSAAEVLYYFVATIRVHEHEDEFLNSITWFTSRIPEVQQLWREGKLVPGTIIGSK